MEKSLNSTIRCSAALLNGRDMLEHHMGNYDMSTCVPRLVHPEEELQHSESIQQLKDEFRKILTQQRVGKSKAYSMGDWENDRKRMRITQLVGKWNLFGYLEDQIYYVDGYEALHLMEMNRLIVYWNSVVVSIEQAYTLFLGYSESLSLEEYQVYSTLMRSGFHLLKYDADRKYQAEQTTKRKEPLDRETLYVWSILGEMLGKPNRSIDPTNVTDIELYDKVRMSMQNSSAIIKSQEYPKELCANGSGKRKASSQMEPIEPKRMKYDCFFNGHFGCRSKVNKFKKIFGKFDVIQSTLDDGADLINLDTCRFKLLFDLFPSDGTTFKKSEPMVPDYRIFVGTSSDPLPTAAEISYVYKSQPDPKVPILMMRVAESMSIHCFLYNFHRVPSNPIHAVEDCTGHR
ncbi:tRNA-splicing endonuclease subunit Sen54 isoform X2 [Toxorhynchites rutilus septentrionalis]|nr:tRNA-splicing endonuclease subunit Sen54 isoform X2 [Toxorhynchites rutilus septentrionalis]